MLYYKPQTSLSHVDSKPSFLSCVSESMGTARYYSQFSIGSKAKWAPSSLGRQQAAKGTVYAYFSPFSLYCSNTVVAYPNLGECVNSEGKKNIYGEVFIHATCQISILKWAADATDSRTHTYATFG